MPASIKNNKAWAFAFFIAWSTSQYKENKINDNNNKKKKLGDIVF